MEPIPEAESQPARLEISGGKSAFVVQRAEDSTHQIVVKHSQKQSNLTVYTVRSQQDRSVSMAFCFELKNIKFFPGVDPNSKKLILIKAQSEPEICKSLLFRWAQYNNQYGSLCSVAEPGQYLNIDKNNNQVVLSSNPDLGFRVQLLKSNTATVNSLLRVHSCGVVSHKRHSGQRKAVQWRAIREGGVGRRTSRRRKKRVL